MKHLLFFLFLFACTEVKSQDTSKVKVSKFEEFSSEDGVLLKMENKKIGKVKGFVMYKKITTDIESGKSLKAVEISEKTGFWVYKVGSIILDEEEIPSLIKILKFFNDTVLPDACKEECPTYSYETKSGVYIFCNKYIGAYDSSWHVYLGKYKLYTALGTLDLEKKELENLIKLLESYK